MKKILVVDDSKMILAVISGLLSDYTVYTADSGAKALEFFETQHPDLILLDLIMPEMTGTELLQIVKADKDLCHIPVVFLTGSEDSQNEAYAFELGAVDYIHKPVDSVVLLARVKMHLELDAYRKELHNLVALKTLQFMQREDVIINLLARVNEFRDEGTSNHVKRTTGYVCAIMDSLTSSLPESYHISGEYYDDIKKSTPLHDIGKTSIPDSISLKPGRLTPEEYEIMKTHVKSGADLLQDAIDSYSGPSFLDVALEIVLTHHERWDGNGYPHRLEGEDIPISGRIMAIADVYDALTSNRPYKPAFSHETAMSVIMENRGAHFDPILVDIFVQIQDEIFKISNSCKDII